MELRENPETAVVIRGACKEYEKGQKVLDELNMTVNKGSMQVQYSDFLKILFVNIKIFYLFIVTGCWGQAAAVKRLYLALLSVVENFKKV